LEENYWAHVEMFPATASQYSLSALNELQIILLNARAGDLSSEMSVSSIELTAAPDALTSDVPTFPYTAEENDRFISMLQLSKGALYFVYSI
jgi:hypothetical protein